MEVYEAVRSLSDIKEDPESTPAKVQNAQHQLDMATAKSDYVSEANQLTRMAWWTVEYGLVGDFSKPKIFGAGLLSSVSESYNCFSSDVKKIPFSLDCINMAYDITRPQPQLFVAPNFESLTEALNEFSKTMAFKRGGIDGLAKAKIGQTTTTTVLDSGLQISGIVQDFKIDSKSRPVFIKLKGPSQLAIQDQEISGQGADYHRDGYSTPLGEVSVGKLWKSSSLLSEKDLKKLGFDKNKVGTLLFKSGIELTGVLKKRLAKNGKTLLLTFENCTVKQGDDILYDPSWGPFDMACGIHVISVFGGAADRSKYAHATRDMTLKMPSQKTNLTQANRKQVALYQQVKDMREGKQSFSVDSLNEIFSESLSHFKDDWLLAMNILELLTLKKETANELSKKILSHLHQQQLSSSEKKNLIQRGLELL